MFITLPLLFKNLFFPLPTEDYYIHYPQIFNQKLARSDVSIQLFLFLIYLLCKKYLYTHTKIEQKFSFNILRFPRHVYHVFRIRMRTTYHGFRMRIASLYHCFQVQNNLTFRLSCVSKRVSEVESTKIDVTQYSTSIYICRVHSTSETLLLTHDR